MSGPAPDLLNRRCLLFTGKGGVGKSTMAAATAVLAASLGRRVLLIEVDAKGDVPAQFEQREVGFTPREVYPGVHAMAMDTEASLREYLRLNLRIPVVGRLGPLARVLDFVAAAAPGVKEILTIGKIAWETRESIEDRPHRRPARRGRRDPRARGCRAVARADPLGFGVDRRSGYHRGQRRHHT